MHIPLNVLLIFQILRPPVKGKMKAGYFYIENLDLWARILYDYMPECPAF